MTFSEWLKTHRGALLVDAWYAARVGMVSVEDACQVVFDHFDDASSETTGQAIANAIRNLADDTLATCQRCGKTQPKRIPYHTCDHKLEDGG